nr:hypothetical protein [Lysinibacillus timonensis]
MNINEQLRSSIHIYVILDLAIKSLQHDQKLFDSFKVKRPYLSLCEEQLSALKEEFKIVKKSLLKQGIRYEKYESTKKNECMYYFLCRGEIIPFHYYGDVLKKHVERKISLTWNILKGETKHEPTRRFEDAFR